MVQAGLIAAFGHLTAITGIAMIGTGRVLFSNFYWPILVLPLIRGGSAEKGVGPAPAEWERSDVSRPSGLLVEHVKSAFGT